MSLSLCTSQGVVSCPLVSLLVCLRAVCACLRSRGGDEGQWGEEAVRGDGNIATPLSVCVCVCSPSGCCGLRLGQAGRRFFHPNTAKSSGWGVGALPAPHAVSSRARNPRACGGGRPVFSALGPCSLRRSMGHTSTSNKQPNTGTDGTPHFPSASSHLISLSHLSHTKKTRTHHTLLLFSLPLSFAFGALFRFSQQNGSSVLGRASSVVLSFLSLGLACSSVASVCVPLHSPPFSQPFPPFFFFFFSSSSTVTATST